jgi:homoserine kinase
MKSVKVFAPATIGNIGPGFDVLGLAIKGIGDIVEAREFHGNDLIIEAVLEADHDISTNPDKNTAGIAAQEALKLLGIKTGVALTITKGMPSGSGLGSSAASAVAGANAVNCRCNIIGKVTTANRIFTCHSCFKYFFFRKRIPKQAIYGGATLTRSLHPLEVTPLGNISDLIIILVMPKVKILTKDSRKILPENVTLSDFVVNLANTASITAAFCKNDYNLLKDNLFDYIIEPTRSTLIPGFPEAKEAALDAGAHGMTISGSGPTVFAITNSQKASVKIESAMVTAFNKKGVECNSLITSSSVEGSGIMKSGIIT